jgi:hypothetical protein
MISKRIIGISIVIAGVPIILWHLARARSGELLETKGSWDNKLPGLYYQPEVEAALTRFQREKSLGKPHECSNLLHLDLGLLSGVL